MKLPLVFITVLSLSVMTGLAQANLTDDLTTMSASDALRKAMQTQDTSVEALIADAAVRLEDEPQKLTSLVAAAVSAYPNQSSQIVYAAIRATPSQKKIIIEAALAALADQPVLQKEVKKAANSVQPNLAENLYSSNTEEEIEFEAEQSEVAAPPTTPPPPPPLPPINEGASGRPPSISAN